MAKIKALPRSALARRRWRSAVFTGLVLAAYSGLVSYLDRNLFCPDWFSGYSLLAAILVLAAFHWRKRFPTWPRLGTAAGWMQFHIYLGASTFVMFGWHLKWAMPQGLFEQGLASIYLLVAGSGVYGLVLTRTVPKRLAQLSRQRIFEQIPLARLELRQRAHQLVFAQADDRDILSRLYVNQIAEFLERPRSWLYQLVPTGRHCRKAISSLLAVDRYLTPPQRELSRSLMNLVREKDDLDFHAAMQGRLKLWLFLHIALTYSLLICAGLHLVLVHAFAGGWR